MKRNSFFIILGLVLAWACKDPVELSSQKEILTFSVSGQTAPAVILPENGTVSIIVDTNTILSEIAPQITVSENASINPASGQTVDFSSGPITYTVTAQDNSTKKWVATAETVKSDSANILTFYLKRQKAPAIISDSTVTIEVKVGTSLVALTPEITISPKAYITPANMEAMDFSAGPVTYVVTSESGKAKHWTVTVTIEKIYEANILSYTIPNQVGVSIFEASTINIEVPVGYDLTSVVPTLTVSEGATVEPQSGVAVNFSTTGYVDYLVTTTAGSKKSWRVFVTEEVINADHPYIQYMGRVDFTNPLKPKLYAPGTSIFVKFKGTFCQLLINDQELYGSYHNYLEIVVDGTQFTRIKNTAKKNTINTLNLLGSAATNCWNLIQHQKGALNSSAIP